MCCFPPERTTVAQTRITKPPNAAKRFSERCHSEQAFFFGLWPTCVVSVRAFLCLRVFSSFAFSRVFSLKSLQTVFFFFAASRCVACAVRGVVLMDHARVIFVVFLALVLNGCRQISGRAEPSPAVSGTTDSESSLSFSAGNVFALFRAARGQRDVRMGGARRSTERMRRLHALATTVAPLRLRVVVPPPRPAQGGVSRNSDPRSCAAPEQRVIVGPANTTQGNASAVAGSSGTADGLAVEGQMCPSVSDVVLRVGCTLTCSQNDTATPLRQQNVALAMQSAGARLERVVSLQQLASFLTFADVPCGRDFNVSGSFSANLVVVATLRPPIDPSRRDDVEVSVPPCRVDPVTMRPVLVHINVPPQLADDRGLLEGLLFPALLHAMGLNYVAASSWLFPGTLSTYTDHNSTTFPKGPLRGSNIRRDPGSPLLLVDYPQAGVHAALVSPNVVATAQAYFRCPTLLGLPLEDEDPALRTPLMLQRIARMLAPPQCFENGARRMLYFEKRILRTEVLTVVARWELGGSALTSAWTSSSSSGSLLRFSVFAVAALRDTGWYFLDDAAADDSMEWGRGRGCGFVNDACGSGNGWPSNYYCNDSAVEGGEGQMEMLPQERCSFERRAVGRCNWRFLDNPVPEAYRQSPQSLRWGSTDVFTDRCPYVDEFAELAAGGSGSQATGNQEGASSEAAPSRRPRSFFCSIPGTTSAPTTPAFIAALGGRIGSSSRCFFRNVNGSRSSHPNDTVGGCFSIACVANTPSQGFTAHVRIDRQYVPCRNGQTFTLAPPRSGVPLGPTVLDSAHGQQRGTLECGDDVESLCQAVTPVAWWPSVESVTPNSGTSNGGITLTIAGKNLANCREVRIGGVALTNVIYHFPTSSLRARTTFVPVHLGSAAVDGVGPADVEVWCNVTDACPEGCGVARLTGGFNLTALLPCNFTVDSSVCSQQPRCEWAAGRCAERVVTPQPVPTPQPTPVPLVRIDPGCFLEAPVKCVETGTCAPLATLCLRCSETAVQCWNSECRPSFDLCPCPPTARVRCPLGGCAVSIERCAANCSVVTASTTSSSPSPPSPGPSAVSGGDGLLGESTVSQTVKCWDQSCVASEDACPCPPEFSRLCNASIVTAMESGDGRVSSRAYFCAQDTPAKDACAGLLLPPVPPLPPAAGSDDMRVAACPVQSPFRCRDGACVVRASDCRCWAQTPIRCADGTCASRAAQCPCPRESPIACPFEIVRDGSPSGDIRSPCAASHALCFSNATDPPCGPPQERPGSDGLLFLSLPQVRCSGSRVCALSEELCPCSALASSAATPVVWIYSRDVSVYDDAWVHILGDGSLEACVGIDFSATLRFTWAITEVGSQWPLPLPSGLLRSRLLLLPPLTLVGGRHYVATLTAVAPASGRRASTRIVLSCRQRQPVVSIFGGERDVPARGKLMLRALVSGDPATASGIMRWSCCPPSADDGERCSSITPLCPQLFATVVDLRTDALTIQNPLGLPQGSFLFTVRYARDGYKNASATTRVTIVAGELPSCTLYLSDAVAVYDHLPITIHSIVTFSGAVTQKWSINGSILTGATASSLVLPPGVLPAGHATTVSTVVTTSTDQQSQCRVVVIPLAAPPRGRCLVRNNDPTSSAFHTNIGVASSTPMEIQAVSWGSDEELRFRFGYLDNEGVQVLLSPIFSPVPRFLFRAPLLVGNPSLLTVQFFVQVSSRFAQEAGVRLSVSVNDTCAADLKGPNGRTTVELVESLAVQLRLSRQNGSDSCTSLLLALRLASMLSDEDLESSRRQSLARFVVVSLAASVTTTASPPEAAPLPSPSPVPLSPVTLPLSQTQRSILIDAVRFALPYLPLTTTAGAGGSTPPTPTTTITAPSPVPTPRDAVVAVLKAVLSFADGVLVDVERDGASLASVIAWVGGSSAVRLFLHLTRMQAAALPVGAEWRALIRPPISTSSTGSSFSPVSPSLAAWRRPAPLLAGVLMFCPSVSRAGDGGSAGSVGVTIPAGAASILGSAAATGDLLCAVFSGLPSTPPPLFPDRYAAHLAPPTPLTPGSAGAQIDGATQPNGTHTPPREAPPAVAAVLVSDVAWFGLVVFDPPPSSIGDSSGGRESGETSMDVTSGSSDDLEGRGASLSGASLSFLGSRQTGASVEVQLGVWILAGRTAGAAPPSITTRNLSCYTLSLEAVGVSNFSTNSGATQGSLWMRIGPPRITVPVSNPPSPGGPEISPETSSDMLFATATCSGTALLGRFVAVFDESQFPPSTPAPTLAPSRFDALRSVLTEPLSGGAVAGITVGSLLVVVGIAIACYVRRQKNEVLEQQEEIREKSQIMLVAELIHDDPDLRVAMDIARIRAQYAADL